MTVKLKKIGLLYLCICILFFSLYGFAPSLRDSSQPVSEGSNWQHKAVGRAEAAGGPVVGTAEEGRDHTGRQDNRPEDMGDMVAAQDRLAQDEDKVGTPWSPEAKGIQGDRA